RHNFQPVVQANQQAAVRRQVKSIGLVVRHRKGERGHVKRRQRGAAVRVDYKEFSLSIQGVDVGAAVEFLGLGALLVPALDWQLGSRADGQQLSDVGVVPRANSPVR